MKSHSKPKPKNVDYFQVPRKLWRILKRELPKQARQKGRGRPRMEHRPVVNGIWYVLWTGCQWKAVHKDWFGVSSSVLHERFQTWQEEGRWERVMRRMVRFYARERRIGWRWQSLDSKSVPAPLGGAQTGKNPTDRGKSGSKIHLLVDQRGAPLGVLISGANQHDKWYAGPLIFSIILVRTPHQHLCADKGYDYSDVHAIVSEAGYQEHIKHRRLRGEPPVPELAPEDKTFPARRWVVKRTLGWLAKRRSIRSRWCKKPENWLAFVHFACASVLHDFTIYG